MVRRTFPIGTDSPRQTITPTQIEEHAQGLVRFMLNKYIALRISDGSDRASNDSALPVKLGNAADTYMTALARFAESGSVRNKAKLDRVRGDFVTVMKELFASPLNRKTKNLDDLPKDLKGEETRVLEEMQALVGTRREAQKSGYLTP